jgi:polar amino acid transport system substrate-binding protein
MSIYPGTVMRIKCLSLLVLLSCAWLTAQATELVTEDDPPHNMLKDKKIVGVSTEKLEEAFKRSGATMHIQLLPWARAYQQASTDSDTCVYSTARTAERESLFQWVGPIASMDWVLYARADNPVKINQLEDVRDEVIGGYFQDVISLWLISHGYHVDVVSSDDLNPAKLQIKRFNYWASSRPRATALLEKQGLTKSIDPVLTFGHTDLFLACNLSIQSDLVKKLNDALLQMKNDGTSAKIDAKYVP